MKLRRLTKFGIATALIGVVALFVGACSSPAPTPTQPPPQVAKNLIVYADIVTGGGGTVKAPASCVLNNQYKRGNQIVFRARVIDPATGNPMDDKALKSVQVTLPDGQTFDAKYGGHPAKTPADYFWATSWVVPDNYPTGSLGYKIVAQSTDGRTGESAEFNVAPSLLTIVQ